MNIYVGKIVVAFIEAITYVLFFSVVAKKNIISEEKKTAVLLVFSYSIIAISVRAIVPFGLHSIVIALFNIILFSMVTNVSLKTSILSFGLFTIYVILFEGVFYYSTVNVLKTDIASLMDKPYLHNLVSLISVIINLFVLVIIVQFKNINLVLFDNKEKRGIINFWILGLVSLGSIMMAFAAMKKYNLHTKYFDYAVYVIFIFFLILGFFQYKSSIEHIKIKYNFEKNKKELENLESMIDVIRKQKHDFANIINTVYAISVMNKPDSNEKIRTYLKTIINDNTTPNYFYKTGNDYLDGLLAIKKKDSDNEKIKFEVDFDSFIDGIKIDNNDLVKVVSNIIDNAVEALRKYDIDNKIISIYHWIENNTSNISISNNGPVIKENQIKKIFNKGFTEKNNDGKEHGYGLYIVKEIIEKNNGEIVVQSDENSTEFLVKIPI